MIGIVTPRDLYSNRRRKSLQVKGPKSFYKSPHTGQRYEILNSQLRQGKVPTPEDVLEYQHYYLRQHYSKTRKEFSDVVDILNNSNKKDGYILYDIDIQEVINNLEEVLGHWQDDPTSNSLENIIKQYKKQQYISKEQYNQLYNNFNNLYNKINNSGVKIETLKNFKVAIQQLANISYSIDKQTIKFNQADILSSLAYIGKKVKGRFLELAVLEHIKQITDGNINNLTVIDTAIDFEAHLGPTGEITSTGKQSISDIKIFKTSKGTKISIEELIEELKNLNNKEKQIVLKANNVSILGIQAKAGKNRKSFNNATITLNDVLIMSKNRTLQLLHSLMYEPTGKIVNDSFFKTDKNLPKNKQIYNILVTYYMTRNLFYVLGYDNAILDRKSVV